MPALRPFPRFLAGLRHVPDLRARTGFPRGVARSEKGVLVAMMTDPVADMLTRIRNGISARHSRVEMPSSRLKERIARILSAEGFVDGFSVAPVQDGKPHRTLNIELRYSEVKASAITGLRRISKPGHRRYSRAADIGRVQGGLGVAIVSTSQGLLTDREARRRRLGGEILCEVW